MIAAEDKSMVAVYTLLTFLDYFPYFKYQ